jgi:hypothetical protein
MAKAPSITHPGYPGITAEFALIDPDQAAKLLAGMAPNRSQRGEAIDSHVRDMASGRWPFTGATIVLDETGAMIDGQHRCQSVIASGVALWMLLVRGVPRENQGVIDTGKARNAADHLTFAGVPNATLASAIARRIRKWEASEEPGFAHITPTHPEIYATLNDHPEVAEAAAFAQRARKHHPDMRIVRPSVWGFAWWLFTALEKDTAEYFLGKALTGTALPSGSPMMAVSRRVQSGEKFSEKEQLALLVRAWNAFRGGEEMRLLKTPPGGIPKPY